MNAMGVISLILVGIGILLISLGAGMSLHEFNKTGEGKLKTRADSFGGTITGLAKLVEALKPYPTGQRLIVFGILILIIAGLFGGIGSL